MISPQSVLQQDNVDVECVAGRSLLAGRSIGHTADSLESTSRSNSGVAGTASGAGTNNPHTVYDRARHTEIPNAQFYGSVSFAHSSQSTARTRKDMENLGRWSFCETRSCVLVLTTDPYWPVQTQIDWSNLLSELSVISQDEYRSAISPFDNDNPN